MSVLPCKKAPSLFSKQTSSRSRVCTPFENHARPSVLAQDTGWPTPRTHLTSHAPVPVCARPITPARPSSARSSSPNAEPDSVLSRRIAITPGHPRISAHLTQQVLTRPDQRGCTTGHRCRTCREWRTGSDRSPCQASPRWPETCVLACATGQSTWAIRSASTKFMPHAMHVSASRAATSPCCPLAVVGGGFEQTSLACTRKPGARYSGLHLAKTTQHRWPPWPCKARQRQDGWVSVTSQTGGEDVGHLGLLVTKGQGAYRMLAFYSDKRLGCT
ncbi:hypothetical protein B0T11DRAFT_124872 [Plectosphaerella cucumerina]|uniref:Uncharacterized protein n=1 Tax=Plectosphaerella cucumerina TaxID=40658 RepID=A0A8K0TB09_9PEZI|nr:hypothetical protein B0T11DRAFT_124872 [Plectosphaerella cucumerina]